MNGGGLMIYARDVMPSKKLAKHNPSEEVKLLLLSWISENASGYCGQNIAHPSKIMITFLIMLIKV